jgi:TonB family protein
MVIRLPKNSPFVTSLVLHATALVLLLFFVLVDFIRPRKTAHVFEMVSPPEAAVAEATPPVAPPRKTPPPPKATPAPPVKPQAREMISITEFRKKNPLPKPRPVQPPARTPVSVPTLKVPDVKTPPSRPPARKLSQQQMNALANYSARMRGRIDAAWKKPSNLGGLALELNAVFEVSASGAITGIRFSPGSGNVAFDNSVLAALRSLANAGPTPTGQAHTFKMAFRLD